MQRNGPSPGKRTLVEMAYPPAPPVAARPALDLQRATVEPAVRGGVRADGEELRVAIIARDAKQIMAILARNASSESMAALCQAAGPRRAIRLKLSRVSRGFRRW